MKTLITGFPRIGKKRELKKALEAYWRGKINLADLERVSAELRKRHCQFQKEAGIDLIGCNDFSWYDQMLDTALMTGAVPERFSGIGDRAALYFAMARGTEQLAPLEMTKWFNTNYHYLVPELTADTVFTPDFRKIRQEFEEARAEGITPKINVIGPLTFLRLSRMTDGSDTLKLLDPLVSVYRDLLEEVSRWGTELVLQLEEPWFVKDPSDVDLAHLEEVYRELSAFSSNVKILVSTYFDQATEAAVVLDRTGIWGLSLDFVSGPENFTILDKLKKTVLVAGVVDGRNIWKTDRKRALSLIKAIEGKVGEDRLILSTSCSLLHVPYSLKEEQLGPLGERLSFAEEKCRELRLLADEFTEKKKSLAPEYSLATDRQEMDLSFHSHKRPADFKERKRIQQEKFNLPLLPTTTIGSFPQTPELRKLRKQYRQGQTSLDDYRGGLNNYIRNCIDFQLEAGLDVLVHGEPERTDMVEYFGEQLEGFAFTKGGWVQSYGSRCVKPPILHGDVSRPNPMTVEWISTAQNLTDKPVKGMLTGPVTILNWSFVRNDIPRSEAARQIALSLREEIADLQEAGIGIIQVDEAALKEGYPLRKAKVAAYEQWAVGAFRLTVSNAVAETQIHTHMCYSDFNDIITAIEAMDADVITIENVRSGSRLLDVFREIGYSHDIGPGVYDIHSPRVPSVGEMVKIIRSLLSVLDKNQLWVNPDCGLKTRRWEEVRPALANMVQAAETLRSELH